MFRRVLGKTLGFVGYTVQYGCIGHCAFEYIGEVVVVCIITITELMIGLFLLFFLTLKPNPYIFIHAQGIFVFFVVVLLQCSGPSMEPTIVNHDIVFSERMSRHLCKIQKWVPVSGIICSRQKEDTVTMLEYV